jgi:voltage-gated potassium channel
VPEPSSHSVRGDVAIAVLALVSVLLMVLEVAADLAPDDALFLDRVDLVIASIFLVEWLWRFARADDRRRFVRTSWWELLASIPITHDAAQALRALRLLRILRVLRLFRLVRLATRLRIIHDRSRRFTGDTQAVPLSVTAGVLVLGATLAFHSFEVETNPAVGSLFDSFWWSMCTVTTVGYGDIAPVTTGGRVVALFLMLFGVGVLAAYTALVASFLVRSRLQPGPAESDAAGDENDGPEINASSASREPSRSPR